MFAVLDYLFAVDEDVRHARSELVRLGKRRMISDRLRIEHDHIGKVAFREATAFSQLEVFSR